MLTILFKYSNFLTDKKVSTLLKTGKKIGARITW